MSLDFNLLRPTERFHYDHPTCGVLVDVFLNGHHWHAIATAERQEWFCHNGFGETKEQAIKEAVTGLLILVKEID